MNTDSLYWQRLSPWAIALFATAGLVDKLKFGIYVIPVAFTGAMDDLPPGWWLAALALLLAHTALLSWLRWWRFHYALDQSQQQFELRTGALFKTEQRIPLDRIQNVRIDQPLPMRAIGKVNLIIETAGSRGSEATLFAIAVPEAQQLKQQLVPATVPPSASGPAPASDSLRRTPAQLFVHGICFNNLTWLAVVLGPLLSQSDWFVDEQWLAQHPHLATGASALMPDTPHAMVLVVTLLLLLCYLLLSLTSGLACLLKYHPYRLSFGNARLQRTGGVITKQQDLMQTHRIQSLQLRQSALARMAGLWLLTLKQVQGSGHDANQGNAMHLPALSGTETQTNLDRIDPRFRLPTRWTTIHRFWLWRRIGWSSLAVLTSTAVVATVTELNGLHSAALLLVIWPVFVVAWWLRWRQWGFAADACGLWIRQGLFGHSLTLLPWSKWQSIASVQTPAMKSRQLMTLRLSLASGRHLLPCLDQQQAEAIMQQGLNQVRGDHRPWL
ncbi:putative membrane protein [Ferrimonas sediminum]|uniref:Putative membrane protein n=1 Tax=Ferrimonas sediminum TaxID=718193 RepID=A0A1G8TNC1_9GAMM|nr:PH domain-containing protein [Ferrimonas sediminum]SDJ43039.1 putative membrane protein [Ferrimonas sediminum]